MTNHVITPHVRCRACRSANLERRIDFGDQPICNRYLDERDSEEAVFPRELVQCPSCGLLQIARAIPAMELRPRFDWIRYDEAEGHLDQMVDEIIRSTSLSPGQRIYGLSYKDASTLGRFQKRGFTNTVLVDLAKDLGDPSPCAGVETIQDLFDEAHVAAMVRTHGAADLIIIRHVIEHAHDLGRLAGAAKRLLAPGGYLVVEVPDFTIPLELCDYCTIWEEHTVFFTPQTLTATLSALGFDTVKRVAYPQPLENALVAIARVSKDTAVHASDPQATSTEMQKGRRYAELFPRIRGTTQKVLADFSAHTGPVAVFGAGHLACDFINLLALKEDIAFVVDDHPGKMGRFMPGSHLPILGSRALLDKNARLCLLTLKPETEEVVIHKLGEFLKRGGVFANIFPNGPRSLRHQMQVIE